VRLRNRPSPTESASGFTLVELLVIIMVLGILAAVVVTAAMNLTGDTSVASCKADFKTIETAQEAYRVQVGTSATSFNDLTGTTVGVNGTTVGPWIKEAPSSDHGYVIGFDLNPGSTFGNITVASTNPAHAAQEGNANCAYA
jgi:type II secretory pathway pseudopilin PulG